MRSLSLLFPASLLVLGANAVAQTEATLSTESGSTSKVQVIASAQPFAFYDSDAEWISGAYAMSNGWRLKVDPSRDGIVAYIDRQSPRLVVDPSLGGFVVQTGERHPVKLTAVSRDRYVTADGNIAMEFNRGQQGDEMLMSYVPDSRTAQVVVVSSVARLAQR